MLIAPTEASDLPHLNLYGLGRESVQGAWSTGGFAHLVCRGLCSPGLQGALLTWSAGGFARLVCRGLCSPGLQGALLTWSAGGFARLVCRGGCLPGLVAQFQPDHLSLVSQPQTYIIYPKE